MICPICHEDSIFDYKVCHLCRGVLIIATERRSQFIEEMMASPASNRARIRARWRDENRRHFYPESARQD